MKLKTMLHKDGPQGRAFVDYIEGSEVDHDAVIAHALMQAMDDLIAKWGDGTCCIETTKGLMLERADELMSQWGFDTGEDA